jgi:hypothetical protein
MSEMAADRPSAAASAEAELIAAARDGDEGAFARLVDPLRGELHALTGFAFRGHWDPELNRFITGDRRVRLVAARRWSARLGAYSWDAASDGFEPLALQVLTLRGNRIAEIDGWVDAALFDRFGLAQRLDAA